jgi:phosphoketolase
MEVLSEHLCQGWLEGYLLTGRHGLFNCYEAFIHIVDSMFNQHAEVAEDHPHIPWRAPIASLNYLLSSHVWRQDHNGPVAPGSRASSTTWSTRRPRSSGSTCRRTPTRCSR